MFSGDSLSVLLFLVATVIAAVMGALTAPPGWRTKTLIGIAAIFALATLAWLIAPAANPIIHAMRVALVAAVQGGALVMVGVVAIVAIMTRRNPGAPLPFDVALLAPEPDSSPPVFAAGAASLTKWTPNITFIDSMMYFYKESRWGGVKERTGSEIKDLLTAALQRSKISSWGRRHPSDKEFQIKSQFWNDVEITLESNCVFSSTLNASAYEVRLCRQELEAFWPPKDDPGPSASA